jgi:hypothetical protein
MMQIAKNCTWGSKIVIGLFKKITIDTKHDEIKPGMKKIAKDYGFLSSDIFRVRYK